MTNKIEEKTVKSTENQVLIEIGVPYLEYGLFNVKIDLIENGKRYVPIDFFEYLDLSSRSGDFDFYDGKISEYFDLDPAFINVDSFQDDCGKYTPDMKWLKETCKKESETHRPGYDYMKISYWPLYPSYLDIHSQPIKIEGDRLWESRCPGLNLKPHFKDLIKEYQKAFSQEWKRNLVETIDEFEDSLNNSDEQTQEQAISGEK